MPSKKAVLPKRKRPNHLAQERFIASYVANNGVKLTAAKEADIGYSTVMEWFHDEDFCARVKMAEEIWVDEIKAALRERAKSKSDQAAFFLLKAKEPETYDDRTRHAKWCNDHGVQDPEAALRPIVYNFLPKPEK